MEGLRRLSILALVCLLCVPADDDCNAIMNQLASAQRDALVLSDVVDALIAAINAPSWDAVTDAWMIVALDGAEQDLIGALNAAAVLSDQAHAAHCY